MLSRTGTPSTGRLCTAATRTRSTRRRGLKYQTMASPRMQDPTSIAPYIHLALAVSSARTCAQCALMHPTASLARTAQKQAYSLSHSLCCCMSVPSTLTSARAPMVTQGSACGMEGPGQLLRVSMRFSSQAQLSASIACKHQLMTDPHCQRRLVTACSRQAN